jgi:hypothetical protein
MQIHAQLYYIYFGINLLIFMVFNAHYVECMHFGNILIQENKFYGSWIIWYIMMRKDLK